MNFFRQARHLKEQKKKLDDLEIENGLLKMEASKNYKEKEELLLTNACLGGDKEDLKEELERLTTDYELLKSEMTYYKKKCESSK